MAQDAAAATKTEGAYKGGKGRYYFDVEALTGIAVHRIFRGCGPHRLHLRGTEQLQRLLVKALATVPAVPEPPESDPEEAIDWAETGATARAGQDSELMSKCQVLEDEIVARLEGRSECFRKSGDDLEHRAESARDHREVSTTAWVDGVLANDNGLPRTVRYDLLTPLLLNEVQRQADELETLLGVKEEVADLRKELANLKRKKRFRSD